MAATFPLAPTGRAATAVLERRRGPRRRGARDLARALHRVLGLAAGIFLVIAGLSGSALVFRAEIDRALNPHLLVATPAATSPAPSPAPLQPALERVARLYPGEPVTRVRAPQAPDGTWELWLGDAPTRYVYVDPWRGTVLGARRPTEFLAGWLFLLHSRLLAGEPGHLVAGVVALLLVALSFSGLVAWWPRRAPWTAWPQWRQAMTVKRGTGAARVTFDLHRAAGFWTSALLLLAGITGASLVFHDAFQRLAHVVTASRPAPRSAPPAAPARPARGPALPVDALLAAARRAQPGGTITYLYLPTAPGQAFRLRQRLPVETHPTGKSFVHVDPFTGRVLAIEDGARASRGERLYSVLYPLHIGVVGGTGTRVLAVLAGLALPLLAVSGALVRRRRVRRARGR